MITISASTKLWAFAMAEQFEKHGLLDELITTYAYSKNNLARRFIKRVDKEHIPVAKIHTNIFLAFPIGIFRRYPHIWNELFDQWAASKLKPGRSNVFIGWSGMSLHTIRRAKQLGMICILERGSSHILYQNQILKDEYKKFDKSFAIHPLVIRKEIAEYEEADYIAVPSCFVRDSFIEKGVNPSKLFMNEYGAGTAFTSKKTTHSNTEGRKFRIVYAGTLSIRKGLTYFFQALENLDIPQNAYEVWFFGSIEPFLQSTINQYKKENWKFFGSVNHYDLPGYFSQCDVGIQPSLEEGLSMVIPQMMACELAMIVTTNTGGANIIKDGNNGFVVPIRDTQAIKNKIELLFKNPGLLNSIRKKAAEDVRGAFTWDSYGDRYVEFLKSLKIIKEA